MHTWADKYLREPVFHLEVVTSGFMLLGFVILFATAGFQKEVLAFNNEEHFPRLQSIHKQYSKLVFT